MSRSLLKKELYSYCKSDSLSEEGLRQIIERHASVTRVNLGSYKFFIKACRNGLLTEGIIQCLLEYFPDAARATDQHGQQPLHFVCRNPNVTPNIIQLLMDAAPDSVRRVTNNGLMPLHSLCCNQKIDDATAIEILKLLLEKHPAAVRHADNNGVLPMHISCGGKSLEFCRELIKAYPGSERILNSRGMLPLHYACKSNTVAVVEYLYRLHPDAISHAAADALGGYPFHYAIASLCPGRIRDDPVIAVDVVKFMLDCNPNVAQHKLHGTKPLLHWVCQLQYEDSNIHAALGIIEAICNAYPESVREEDSEGHMFLHLHGINSKQDGATAILILKLLIEKCPESVRHASSGGDLPIHLAAISKPPEYCRVLIEAYPGSERISNVDGMLPLHFSCTRNTVAAVEYLYKLHPDAINHATIQGLYPIHYAIGNLIHRDNPIATVEYLLDCDPNVKVQKMGRKSLLHCACNRVYNDSTIDAALEIIEAIYDAHPEAIYDNRILSFIHRCHERVQTFFNHEFAYAHDAKNHHHQMTTPGIRGRLPLHRALQNNVRLGSIKLLVKGHPPAVQSPDNRGALPLHIACQHHESASVVQYLVELDATTLDAVNRDGNTALHIACHFARHHIIALFLDNFDAVSVSKRNAQKKLPIDLLWESNLVSGEC